MKFPLNVFQLHGFLSTHFFLLTTEIVILFDNILLLPKTFTLDTYTSNTRCIGQGWWIRKSHLSSMLLYTMYVQYTQPAPWRWDEENPCFPYTVDDCRIIVLIAMWWEVSGINFFKCYYLYKCRIYFKRLKRFTLDNHQIGFIMRKNYCIFMFLERYVNIKWWIG